MPFTPPPSKSSQIEVIIESAGNENRVLVSNAGSHPNTGRIRAQLSAIGWEVAQMRSDAYSASLYGVSLEAIMVLCKEIRSEYGLSGHIQRVVLDENL